MSQEEETKVRGETVKVDQVLTWESRDVGSGSNYILTLKVTSFL